MAEHISRSKSKEAIKMIKSTEDSASCFAHKPGLVEEYKYLRECATSFVLVAGVLAEQVLLRLELFTGLEEGFIV